MVDGGPSEGKDAPMNLRTLSRHGSYWGLGLLAIRTVTGCLVATTDPGLDDSTGRTTAETDGDQDGVPDGTSAASDAYGAFNQPPLVPITLQQDGKAATKFIEYCKSLRVCAMLLDPRTIQPRGGSPR
jgi:hypothetical protein